MRYMMLIKATAETEAGIPPSKELIEAMTRYNEELTKAGVMLTGEGLRSSAHGALVRFTPHGTTVTDGPFTETKELIAGFWIIDVKSKEEAVEWARRVPRDPAQPDAEYDIEVRRVFEGEDLEAAFAEDQRLANRR
ncbi:MAG TPA: YciI family protein [Amycolatopsis sp.]|nr:YciI family protein [Amycolatopsis sp.]